MDLEFASLKELYEHIKPALRTKKNEMRLHGYSYITEDDIWNYLKEIKWIKSRNLSLYDMVNDILNSDEYKIDGYFKEKLKQRNRHIYFDELEDVR